MLKKSASPPPPIYPFGKDIDIRKNDRLYHMVPPDVLMLKGEVLRSAISHHEVENLKHLNRVKKYMYEQYSVKQSPSIQQVRWRPEHFGLRMQGMSLDVVGQGYAEKLFTPPDRHLKKSIVPMQEYAQPAQPALVQSWAVPGDAAINEQYDHIPEGEEQDASEEDDHMHHVEQMQQQTPTPGSFNRPQTAVTRSVGRPFSAFPGK